MLLVRAGLFGAKGNWRVIRNSQGSGVLATVTVSMINAADPYFHSPPKTYDPLAFPETSLPDDGYGFNEYNVHFLSLCMKVAPRPLPSWPPTPAAGFLAYSQTLFSSTLMLHPRYVHGEGHLYWVLEADPAAAVWCV